jgi:nucleoside 2-deoxyribosyltransferase
MKRAYLASPLGFAASTKPFMEQLEAALADLVEVMNPWRFGTVTDERPRVEAITDRTAYANAIHELNHRIAAANETAIRACDIVIAILDGVDVDSGTASEIGFAFALDKQVWGLRTDFRLTGENMGAVVNLQVQYWIEASGGQIARTTDALLTALR